MCDVSTAHAEHHNTRFTLRLDATWWRASNASVDVRRCAPPYACDDESTNRTLPLTGDALCDAFHEGVRCGNCSAGAYRHLDGGCLPCKETALTAVLASLAAVLLVAGAAALLWRLYR